MRRVPAFVPWILLRWSLFKSSVLTQFYSRYRMLSLLFGAVILLYRTFCLYVFVDLVCFEFIDHRNTYHNFKFSPSLNRNFVIADFTTMFHAQFERLFLICTRGC